MFPAGTLPTRIVVFGLLLLIPARALAQIPARASAQGRPLPASGSSRYAASLAASPTDMQRLAETLELYLSSSSNYQEGDLLWRSQLEEFQEYLKRTGRCSEATHSKWLRRTLQDRSPLVLFFHAGGHDVLRRAAKKMGGYAELDPFSHTGQGKKMLQRAIETDSETELVDALRARRAQAVQLGIAQPRPLPIYSAQDFLHSLAPRTESAQRHDPRPDAGGSPRVPRPTPFFQR